MSLDFYKSIPTQKDFDEATNIAYASQVPDDWFVAIADVENSTNALRAGRYKDVNAVSVATLAALLNCDRSVEIPYVFGGDGALAAVPNAMYHKVASALLGARKLALDGFGLNLKVALIPASYLKQENQWLKVSKYQASETRTQACFLGRGWDFAESILKSKDNEQFLVKETESIKADANFEGFECRWEPIACKNDFIVSLVVQSLSSNPSDHMAVYCQIVQEITAIYRDLKSINPVSKRNLKLTLRAKYLRQEALVRSRGKGGLLRLRILWRLFSLTLLGRILMGLGLRTNKVNWKLYKTNVVNNSDYFKFDGSLKIVLDSKKSQFDTLQAYLDNLASMGKIAYGIERSNYSMMTCIVFSYENHHVHFVDGGHGGYASAASKMKTQLRK